MCIRDSFKRVHKLIRKMSIITYWLLGSLLCFCLSFLFSVVCFVSFFHFIVSFQCLVDSICNSFFTWDLTKGSAALQLIYNCVCFLHTNTTQIKLLIILQLIITIIHSIAARWIEIMNINYFCQMSAIPLLKVQIEQRTGTWTCSHTLFT